MKTWCKLLLFEAWFFFSFPALFFILVIVPAHEGARGGIQFIGIFVCVFMWLFWLWQWYAYAQYRQCRQEEFLFIVQTAAAAQAPLEQVLRAYLNDRPREHFFRGLLLFFVFPGYYWLHLNRSFDARLSKLMKILDHGIPLDQALAIVPGIATRETILAAAVGQYTNKLNQAMKRIPEGRLTPVWMEVTPRLVYPVMLLGAMTANLSFLMIFIIPKFEKIFLEFKMKLPYATEIVIAVSRWWIKYWYLGGFCLLLAVAFLNAWILSSTLRWHTPLLGRLYKMKVRGEFLQMLGIMLETGRPLEEILEGMLESQLLSSVVRTRVVGLLADLTQGLPFADSMVRHELASPVARGLIASAEKARNLPWALQELGDTLNRRSARIAHRTALLLYPLMVVVCASLIALIAVAMFSPLTKLLEGLSDA